MILKLEVLDKIAIIEKIHHDYWIDTVIRVGKISRNIIFWEERTSCISHLTENPVFMKVFTMRTIFFFQGHVSLLERTRVHFLILFAKTIEKPELNYS